MIIISLITFVMLVIYSSLVWRILEAYYQDYEDDIESGGLI